MRLNTKLEAGWCTCKDSEWFWEEYDVYTLDYLFERRVKEKICMSCHKPKGEDLVVINQVD